MKNKPRADSHFVQDAEGMDSAIIAEDVPDARGTVAVPRGSPAKLVV